MMIGPDIRLMLMVLLGVFAVVFLVMFVASAARPDRSETRMPEKIVLAGFALCVLAIGVLFAAPTIANLLPDPDKRDLDAIYQTVADVSELDSSRFDYGDYSVRPGCAWRAARAPVDDARTTVDAMALRLEEDGWYVKRHVLDAPSVDGADFYFSAQRSLATIKAESRQADGLVQFRALQDCLRTDEAPQQSEAVEIFP